MRRCPALIAALALMLAGAGSAHAQTPAPPRALGTDGHGVRLVQRGHPARLVALLSPDRYRALAGHELLIACAPAPRVTLGGAAVRGPLHGFHHGLRPPGGVVVRLHPPRRRGPLMTHLSPHWDWCAMTLRKARRDGSTTTTTTSGFATVPLTAAGAAFADERHAAGRVIAGMFFLRFPGRQRSQIVQRVARLLHAVVLASPTQEPPPGRLGLYSAGHEHVYAAQRDRTGDLLFYEQDGDVTRTNLLRYLQDDSLLSGADLLRP